MLHLELFLLLFIIFPPNFVRNPIIPHQQFVGNVYKWHHAKEHVSLPLNQSYRVLSYRNCERCWRFMFWIKKNLIVNHNILFLIFSLELGICYGVKVHQQPQVMPIVTQCTKYRTALLLKFNFILFFNKSPKWRI